MNKMKSESGSIMLEVVAVLALMGVMGAMLFRQVYQRNQELHNIQMASEIRTVKEAFAAYIKANHAAVATACGDPDDDVINCPYSSLVIAGEVKQYLPDGWFAGADPADGGPLNDAYHFTLWSYKDPNNRKVVYGVVVPTDNTLPTTGWNFRRAARVALLIGADGGAYGRDVTGTDIAGSLGTWHLDGSGIIAEGMNNIYVAITGIDIFAPEYEAPEGAVGLPSDWDLALRDLHAYRYFAVGQAGTGPVTNCYSIAKDGTNPNKRAYDSAANMVENDDITGNIPVCQPLFWVGSDTTTGKEPATGNVYVLNDLNVGADTNGTGDHALSLTKEGVIKQKDGLTIDKDGRIIAKDTVSADIGELKAGEHFVVDPAYTSTMNDIRLASRGGARLSDILPNYILKNVFDGSCKIGQPTDLEGYYGLTDATTHLTSTLGELSWCDIENRDYSLPDCPSGYSKAVVVIPTFVGGEGYKRATHTHEVKILNTDTPTADYTKYETNTVSEHSHKIPKIEVDTGAARADFDGSGGIWAGLTPTEPDERDAPFIFATCQSFAAVYFDKDAKPHPLGVEETADTTKTTFRVAIGYRSNRGDTASRGNGTSTTQRPYACRDPGSKFFGIPMHATIQTFCVWTPSLYSCVTGDSAADCNAKKQKCVAAGYEVSGNNCTTAHAEDDNNDGVVKGAERSQTACEEAGFEWITTAPAHCRYTYNRSKINAINGAEPAGKAKKRAACKAAKWKWNDADQGSCDCPSGTGNYCL